MSNIMLAGVVVIAGLVGIGLGVYIFDALLRRRHGDHEKEQQAMRTNVRKLEDMVKKLTEVDFDREALSSEGDAFMHMVDEYMRAYMERCEGIIKAQTQFHAEERITMEAEMVEEVAHLKQEYGNVFKEQRDQINRLERTLSCAWVDPLVMYIDSHGPTDITQLAEIHAMDPNSTEVRGRILDAMKRNLLRKEGNVVRRPHQARLRLILGEVDQPALPQRATLQLVGSPS
jgi:hypothetical protein